MALDSGHLWDANTNTKANANTNTNTNTKTNTNTNANTNTNTNTKANAGDKVSDGAEISLQFASKILTPRRMQ